MIRRDFLKSAGLLTGVAAAGQLAISRSIFANAVADKPNIIFILADDLGIANLGCYGADKYKTPQIDALAKSGIRFTHAYTAPLCGPSRACILTGRYAFRTGAVNQDMTGLMKPGEEIMTPAVLQQAGYATASVGKWGQLPLTPADFGFGEYMTFAGSGIYWNSQDKGKRYTVNGEKRKLQDNEYVPDLMHDYLVNFITKHQNQPFYAYYSLSHIHAEILPTPDSATDSKDLYADNIAYMDKLVGKLVAELERLHLREKTLIVFAGDNGIGGKYADEATIGGRRLAGEKGSMLEGGALVPMIVNWPGTTPSGVVTDELTDSTDFLPTFAELAGAKLPDNRVIDGKSLAPLVHGKKTKIRDWVFIELGNQWYAREAGWKLNRTGELYDMSASPFEEKKMATVDNNPAAQAARKRLQTVLDQLNPGGGILDQGDGSGRHAKKKK